MSAAPARRRLQPPHRQDNRQAFHRQGQVGTATGRDRGPRDLRHLPLSRAGNRGQRATRPSPRGGKVLRISSRPSAAAMRGQPAPRRAARDGSARRFPPRTDRRARGTNMRTARKKECPSESRIRLPLAAAATPPEAEQKPRQMGLGGQNGALASSAHAPSFIAHPPSAASNTPALHPAGRRSATRAQPRTQGPAKAAVRTAACRPAARQRTASSPSGDAAVVGSQTANVGADGERGQKDHRMRRVEAHRTGCETVVRSARERRAHHQPAPRDGAARRRCGPDRNGGALGDAAHRGASGRCGGDQASRLTSAPSFPGP